MESLGMVEIQPYGKKKVYLDFGGFDRIKLASFESANSKVEEAMELRVRDLAREDVNDLTDAIDKLEHTMDIDRATMLAFAILGPVTTLLATKQDKRWFRFLGLQFAFLAIHAMWGWCPPSAVLRGFGFRSQKEIDAEKYALKTLRGDFAR